MKNFNVAEFGVVPDGEKLQTAKIQAVLDLCKQGGGCVVFPEGIYRVSSLRLWSNTTVILEKGAVIEGSTDIRDYSDYPDTFGMVFYTDGQLIPLHDGRQARKEYRRAIFSAFAQKNIAIFGNDNSVIDGKDCFDFEGDEGFRGPHAVFFSGCDNIVLKGYTVRDAANFAHQLDNCRNVLIKNVKAEAGHDGVHINQCNNVIIEDCAFSTGDDCIAGINVCNVYVRNCILNTSCNMFRIGGQNVYISHCKMKGIGKYPHKLSLYQGNGKFSPAETGRRNTLFFMEFFASDIVPNDCGCNVTVSDCEIVDVDSCIHYEYNNPYALHTGSVLTEVRFENVKVKGLKKSSVVIADPKRGLHAVMHNVTAESREGEPIELFVGGSANISIVDS